MEPRLKPNCLRTYAMKTREIEIFWCRGTLLIVLYLLSTLLHNKRKCHFNALFYNMFMPFSNVFENKETL